MRIQKQIGILLLSAFAFTACKDELKEEVLSPNIEVNQWVYKNMKDWYYWNDKIPASPNYELTPTDFFESLLNKHNPTTNPDGDRFSWIQESATELTESLSGVSTTTGMEFTLYNQSSIGTIFATVLYTLPNSPAYRAGLRRGYLLTAVNGTTLTLDNYRTLLGGTDTKTYTIGTINDKNQIVSGNQTVSITPERFQENPIFMDTVLTYGSKNVGYLVYHQFIPSHSGSDKREFDKELESIFQDFKTKGVNELIIDFRYNGGGYVSSAVTLASLFAKGINSNSVFAKKEYNPYITSALEKEYGKEFFSDKFAVKTQNIGSQINKTIFLTSSRTASASELVINGLKPYQPVVIIGDVTAGKNVGSVTLTDDKKKIKWGIQPIVSKSFNSLNQSDYSNGFKPDIAVKEYSIVYPYANPNDPLLKAALNELGITVHTTARERSIETISNTEISSSINGKASNGIMIEEIPNLTVTP